MSDEIWASTEHERAESAPNTMPDVSSVMPSIQRSLREIDTQRTSRDIVAHVVAILRDMPAAHTAADTEALTMLQQQYAHWMREEAVISDGLFFQLAEIGAWLAIHGAPASLQSFQTTSLRPATMPHKEAFCDRERQVRFAIQLFDALRGCAATARLTASAAALVVDVFVAWLVRAMNDYAFIFLHHVAQPLVAHIQQKLRVLPDALAGAAQGCVESRLTGNWEQEASSIAVATILLSTSSQGAAAIQSIHALVKEKLQRDEESFPHVHRAVAVLAVALQVAPLALASSPVVHQFILLRAVHLTLASPRLLLDPSNFTRLCERLQESLYRSHITTDEVDACLRMMTASTDEIQAAMDASPTVLSSILKAMRIRSETELFTPSLIALLEEREGQIRPTDPAFPAVQFLANVYDAVVVGIQALSQSPSTAVVLQCFTTLCRLEFARECCATPQRNDLMVQLTQRVEDLVDAAPDATLSALASSVLPPQQKTDRTSDVVFSWACLAVGLMVQRKLRTVLFHASDAARRDAFAVVFAGLYSGLEPLSAFTHRFLTFTLSSLGQFVSVYEMFPFYLQETLRRFPSDVTRHQVASVLGTVFGALYYTNPSQALTEDEKKMEATATETRHAMIMWALRQSRQRTKELLPVVGSAAPDATSDGLYMAELFLEVAKMAPVELLPTVAREMEALVHHCSQMYEGVLHEVKTRVFNAISLNCEAEKRAWLAAWFLELSTAYPSSPPAVITVDDAMTDATKQDAEAAASQAVSRL